MRDTSVLISGASIAGPALAFWLHRFGADVTIVERAPELRPGGQAVDLRGVAKTAAWRMGLEAEIRAACTDTGGMSVVDRDNRVRAKMRADQFGGDGLIAEIEILRGDLSRVLYDATKDDTEYVFGDRITALDEQPDGVHVTFEKAAPRRFDVVIGADGLHSGVRALVFGDESKYLHHLGMYLSFWTVENHLGLENWALGYAEPGRSVGVRTIHDNSKLMAFVSFGSDRLDYDYRDVEAQKAILRDKAGGMAWETPKLLAQLDDAPDFYFDSCSQVKLDSWSRGRIGLFGDAAFCASPISGQGTGLAIVGAYVLAGELAAARGDHAAGFAAYERRMRDWVAVAQKFAAGNVRTTLPKSEFGIRLGMLAMRALPYLPGKSLLLRSMNKMVNGFDLPDYSSLLVEAG
jgi:2-polyprenyl-6-methoxyphenol hydroxylase-like FAD-dependent oxidoreductase